MFNRTRIAGVVTAVCCAAALCLPAQAAEVDCDSVYCFTGADFQEEVVGICVTDLPDPAAGTVLLGTRVVRAGDILTAQQLNHRAHAVQHTAYAVCRFLRAGRQGHDLAAIYLFYAPLAHKSAYHHGQQHNNQI